ncbi:MAG: ketol-acid reductoisomerase [Candidatus Freyarchaeota archaeon]|nr:ketol-acid reductoisomerase [Candidatus Freyrarchaeum guaymaensis]
MAKIYKDADVDSSILNGKTVAVIGYGSQGKAQALNLRDSGVNVILGLRRGKSWDAASTDGFQVFEVPEAVSKADVILMLIPDMVQPEVYEAQVEPNLKDGAALGFAHAFNIHYELIKPPETVDVFMVAPKSPGAMVRELYLEGFGAPALVAVHQDYTGQAMKIALAIAKAIGATRAGAIETTFREEVETDLIGEQCVLVGGLMELIKKGFEVLVEEGYQPEVAYFEVLNEAKLIMDMIYRGGITGMLKAVSDTAKYGGLTVGPRVLDENVKRNMKEAAKKVKDGSFTKEWVEEYRGGQRKLKELMDKMASHQIETVGRELRKLAGIER